ncbi:hypothetical protein CTZ27_36215 [Streptomyces griseocarneus]|nr:hypothetical protein CTZ27_36215 [Streptomyces griseocarneus]
MLRSGHAAGMRMYSKWVTARGWAVVPRLEKAWLEHVGAESRELRVTARTREDNALLCPDCGTVSGLEQRYSGWR